MIFPRNAPPILIRPMRAGDIPAVSLIHIQQFPNNRSTSLGKPFVTKMYRFFLLNESNLSLIAEQDEHPVGLIVGSIKTTNRQMLTYTLPEILLGLVLHPQIIARERTFREWRSYLRALVPRQTKARPNPSFAQGEVYAGLASVAVDAGAQGQGIGKALVEAFESAASLAGATVLGLSVEKDNQTAQRLYKKCGWQLLETAPGEPSLVFIKKINAPDNIGA